MGEISFPIVSFRPLHDIHIAGDAPVFSHLNELIGLIDSSNWREIEGLFQRVQAVSDRQAAMLYLKLDRASQEKLVLKLDPQVIGRIVHGVGQLASDQFFNGLQETNRLFEELRQAKVSLAGLQNNPTSPDKITAIKKQCLKDVAGLIDLLEKQGSVFELAGKEADKMGYEYSEESNKYFEDSIKIISERINNASMKGFADLKKELLNSRENTGAFVNALVKKDTENKVFLEYFQYWELVLLHTEMAEEPMLMEDIRERISLALAFREHRTIQNIISDHKTALKGWESAERKKIINGVLRGAIELSLRRKHLAEDLSAPTQNVPGEKAKDVLDMGRFPEYMSVIKDFIESLNTDRRMNPSHRKGARMGVTLPSTLAKRPFAEALARHLRQFNGKPTHPDLKVYYVDVGKLFTDRRMPDVTKAFNDILESAQHMGHTTLILDVQSLGQEGTVFLDKFLSQWNLISPQDKPSLVTLATPRVQSTLNESNVYQTYFGQNVVTVDSPDSLSALVEEAAKRISLRNGVTFDPSVLGRLLKAIKGRVIDPALTATQVLEKAAASVQSKSGQGKGKVDWAEIQDILDKLPDINLLPIEQRAWARMNVLPKEVQKEVHRLLGHISGSTDRSNTQSYIRYLSEILAQPWNTSSPPLFTDKDKRQPDAPSVKAKISNLYEGVKKEIGNSLYGFEKIYDDLLLPYLADQIQHALLDAKSTGMKIVFEGPPGVGKTVLAKAIARALGRKCAVISMGSMNDKAELKGFPWAYVGSKIGAVTEAMKEAGEDDLVIIFDEIDKANAGQKAGSGDPLDIVSDITDEETNARFVDDYLGPHLPVDLSRAIIFATANNLPTHKSHLFGEGGRFKTVKLEGYTLEQKVRIGVDYILEKIKKEWAVEDEILFESKEYFVRSVVEKYTHELGVRELVKLLERVVLRGLRNYLETGQPFQMKPSSVESILGKPRKRDRLERKMDVGETVMSDRFSFIHHLHAELMDTEKAGFEVRLFGQWGDFTRENDENMMLKLLENNMADWQKVLPPGGKKGFKGKLQGKLNLRTDYPVGEDDATKGLPLLAASVSAVLDIPLQQDVVLIGEVDGAGKLVPLLLPDLLIHRLEGAHVARAGAVVMPHNYRNPNAKKDPLIFDLFANNEPTRGPVLDLNPEAPSLFLPRYEPSPYATDAEKRAVEEWNETLSRLVKSPPADVSVQQHALGCKLLGEEAPLKSMLPTLPRVQGRLLYCLTDSCLEALKIAAGESLLAEEGLSAPLLDLTEHKPSLLLPVFKSSHYATKTEKTVVTTWNEALSGFINKLPKDVTSEENARGHMVRGEEELLIKALLSLPPVPGGMIFLREKDSQEAERLVPVESLKTGRTTPRKEQKSGPPTGSKADGSIEKIQPRTAHPQPPSAYSPLPWFQRSFTYEGKIYDIKETAFEMTPDDLFQLLLNILNTASGETNAKTRDMLQDSVEEILRILSVANPEKAGYVLTALFTLEELRPARDMFMSRLSSECWALFLRSMRLFNYRRLYNNYDVITSAGKTLNDLLYPDNFQKKPFQELENAFRAVKSSLSEFIEVLKKSEFNYQPLADFDLGTFHVESEEDRQALVEKIKMLKYIFDPLWNKIGFKAFNFQVPAGKNQYDKVFQIINAKNTDIAADFLLKSKPGFRSGEYDRMMRSYYGHALLDNFCMSDKLTDHSLEASQSEDTDPRLHGVLQETQDEIVRTSFKDSFRALSLIVPSDRTKPYLPKLLAERFVKSGEILLVLEFDVKSLEYDDNKNQETLLSLMNSARSAGNVVLFIDLDALSEHLGKMRNRILSRLLKEWRSSSSGRSTLIFQCSEDTHIDIVDNLPSYADDVEIGKMTVKDPGALLDIDAARLSRDTNVTISPEAKISLLSLIQDGRADYNTVSDFLDDILKREDVLKRAENEGRITIHEQDVNDAVFQKFKNAMTDMRVLKKRLASQASDMPFEARRVSYELFNFYKKLDEGSLDATETKRRLENILDFPFNKRSRHPLDQAGPIDPKKPGKMVFDICRSILRRTKELMDKTHYGMEMAKAILLDFQGFRLFMRMKNSQARGKPILLLGDPGIGKTTLTRSMAVASGLKLETVPLGGLSDPSQIKGHFSTYINSLPGLFVRAAQRAGALDFIVLMDELDKMAKGGVLGDPYGALLSLLDPEQNNRFFDQHLGVHVDMSKILFVATANTTDGIPPAVLDRFEIIELPGYEIHEKEDIAVKHLLPDIFDDLRVNWHGFYPHTIDISKLLPDLQKSGDPMDGMVFKALQKAAEDVVAPTDKAESFWKLFLELPEQIQTDTVVKAMDAVVFDKDLAVPVLDSPLKMNLSSEELSWLKQHRDGLPVDERHRRQLVRRYLEARYKTGIVAPYRDEIVMDGKEMRKFAHAVIRNYTKESGVRQLKRELHLLISKVVTDLHRHGGPITLTTQSVEKYLGRSREGISSYHGTEQVGALYGLAALTGAGHGGSLLNIHVDFVKSEKKDEVLTHGSLQKDMAESALLALNVCKEHARETAIDIGKFTDQSLFVSMTPAEIKKEGPSAGVAIAVGIMSRFENRPVRTDVAMTGAIGTKGTVAAVGGIKEKFTAAREEDMRVVLLPWENKKDLEIYFDDNPQFRGVVEESGVQSLYVPLKSPRQGILTRDEDMDVQKWKALDRLINEIAAKFKMAIEENEDGLTVSGIPGQMRAFLTFKNIPQNLGVPMTFVLLKTVKEAFDQAFVPLKETLAEDEKPTQPSVYDMLDQAPAQYSFEFRRSDGSLLDVTDDPCGLEGLFKKLREPSEELLKSAQRHFQTGEKELLEFIETHVPADDSKREVFINGVRSLRDETTLEPRQRFARLSSLIEKYLKVNPSHVKSDVYSFRFDNYTNNMWFISNPGGIKGLINTIQDVLKDVVSIIPGKERTEAQKEAVRRLEAINFYITQGYILKYIMNDLNERFPDVEKNELRIALNSIAKKSEGDPKIIVEEFMSALETWLKETPMPTSQTKIPLS